MSDETLLESLGSAVKEFMAKVPADNKEVVYIVASTEADELIRKELFKDEDIDVYLRKLYGCTYTVSPFLDSGIFISFFNYSGVVGERNMRTKDKQFNVNDIFNYIRID